MKIYSSRQLQRADQETLVRQKITSLQLMERAATLAYREIIQDFRDQTPKFKVFCGMGNNGGDGLVIARKLAKAGYKVEVLMVEFTDQPSPECAENLARFKALQPHSITRLTAEKGVEIAKTDIVIDAIFGIGLNRPMPSWVSGLVHKINEASAKVYAIDTPSGLYGDKVPGKDEKVIKADTTLTFQSPKLAFYLPETYPFLGHLKVLNIGLDQEFLDNLPPVATVVGAREMAKIRKKRPRFSHKGTYGHCLVVGGSYGKMGSMVLAARAALRVGSGKVTALVPRVGNPILQVAVPEAMTLTVEGNHILYEYEEPDFIPESISFGMGAGTREETAEFFLDLLKSYKKPLLIDADGLNLLAKHTILQEFIPENSVLTPHPRELKGLLGEWKDSFEKLQKAKEFVVRHHVILVLKDALTLIMTPEKLYVNSTGNAGMATAGSGDVLSGVIGGLMAQSYTPEEAAVFGVYLHGRAGDLAVRNSSPEALIAGDLINTFAQAFEELNNPR